MITGAHVIAFAEDAAAARDFFRDVLEMPSVDAGGGWLIFALPPSEIALHPGGGWGEGEGGHRLFLICDELEGTMTDLRQKGVEFTGEVTQEDWGLLATMVVPGHGEIGLYQPAHPSPLDAIGT